MSTFYANPRDPDDAQLNLLDRLSTAKWATLDVAVAPRRKLRFTAMFGLIRVEIVAYWTQWARGVGRRTGVWRTLAACGRERAERTQGGSTLRDTSACTNAHSIWWPQHLSTTLLTRRGVWEKGSHAPCCLPCCNLRACTELL